MRAGGRSVGTIVVVGIVWLVGVQVGLGGPTLTTITLDGNMGDWAAVLANPANVVNDGPGGGLIDADTPPSARLDIDRVAFTWDATYVYFYIHRQASSGEFNFFWFHFDLDNNGFVANNAPLLSVSWWGTNQKVSTSLDTYRAANPVAGDKITSAAGLHDGYKLPGTRVAGVAIETINSGSPSGLEVEARVSWAALGVAPGTAFQWHVSSSRRANDYPGAIADNAGRGTAYAGVDFSPDRALQAMPGTQLVIAHNIRNTGNVTDTFDLTWTSTGGFAPSLVNFYLDADNSGTLTPGDTLMGDTNGNGLTDTGPMAPVPAPKAILAIAQIPFSAVRGQVCTITSRARSSFDNTVNDTVVDTVTISQPSITLLKSVDKAVCPPGGVLTYSILFTNTGDADAVSVRVVDPIPANTSYVAGSASGAGTSIEFSHDGGASWDASEAPPVTHVRWQRASALPPGSSGSVTFQVAVN